MQSKLLLLFLLTGPLLCPPGRAAPVPDLYVAQVSASALSGEALEEAFGRALDEVLIKVTGQRTLARRQAVGPAGPLVRQYQPGPGGLVRVSFDPGALQRRLDAANLPVWADDRPRTLVILPDDVPAGPVPQTGGSAVPASLPASPVTGPSVASGGSARQLLLNEAAARGIPVVIASEPVRDEPGAEDPLLDPKATARAAGADLLLVGRRAPSGGSAVFRWTLAQGDERSEWQGDAAAGADGLADRLATRYAITANNSTVLLVRIEGVQNFNAYGQLQNYLRSVDLIQSAGLQRVNGNALLFELALRGDINQLNDAFALQRVLEPVADFTVSDPVYRLTTSAVSNVMPSVESGTDPAPPDVP